MRKILLVIAVILMSCKSQPVVLPIPAVEVKQPEFEVVSISILQADLVVTEFETVLRVINPNNFAVDLSSISYELHGNGMYWANGVANDIFRVPAESSSETKFTFSMNFIDMNRRLLDDIIAMRRVNYNFKGRAEVRPVIPGINPFFTNFDCSGMSDVRPR